MIKPVDTRWDSKSRMITRALYLKPAIEDICTRKKLCCEVQNWSTQAWTGRMDDSYGIGTAFGSMYYVLFLL